MREYFPQIVGNEALRVTLGTEISKGDFSHAYILGGPKGSGKHTFAREIAMAAACERRGDAGTPLPCGTCRSCRKICEGLSPDVITVSREEDKVTMGVDVVRALRASVALVPNDLEIKFYIIEDAHTMTDEAQNALLLTLEEPPPFVCFLLLAENTDVLLETVRSRAPIHRMRPIERETLSHYLQQRPAGAALLRDHPEEFAELMLLSGGWIGRALALLDHEQREPLLTRRRLAAHLAELMAAGDRTGTVEALCAHGADREQMIDDLTALEEALRDLLLLTRSEQAPLIFFTNREAAAELAAHFTTARLLLLLSDLQEAKRALNAKANVKLTMTRLMGKLFAH